MKGRRVPINNDLKKKLTVVPFIPGAPNVTSYPVYKLTNKSMYIPRYYNDEGTLIVNETNECEFNINTEPREYQKNVINDIHSAIIKNGSCIACLFTGWGKTFASLYIASLLNVKTLVIVNKESLMEQWSEQIIKFLGFKPGIIQSNKIDVSPNVCIGMIQSISNSELPEDERLKKFQDAFVRLTVYSVGILGETIGKITMADGTEVTDKDQISEFIANADRKIFNSVKEHLDKSRQQTTIDPIQFECKGTTDLEGNTTPCGEKWRQPFTIDNSTFFG